MIAAKRCGQDSISCIPCTGAACNTLPFCDHISTFVTSAFMRLVLLAQGEKGYPGQDGEAGNKGVKVMAGYRCPSLAGCNTPPLPPGRQGREGITRICGSCGNAWAERKDGAPGTKGRNGTKGQ